MRNNHSIAILAFIFTCVFAGLSLWQMQRLGWKQQLIAHMEERLKAEPIDLATWDGREDLDYRHVKLTGRFANLGRMKILSRVRNGEVGFHVVEYFTDKLGRHWLVNRGWANDLATFRSWPAYDTVITGIARKPLPPTRFTPANNPGEGKWYFYEPELMFRAVELAAISLHQDFQTNAQKDYVIELDADSAPNMLPAGGVTRIDLPNNHMAYALTWGALALIMAGIGIMQLRKR